MANEHKIGAEFDDPTRIPFHLQFVQKFLNELTIKPTVRPPAEKDVKALLAKAKGKKAQFVATFEGSLLAVELSVPGSKSIRVVSYDLDALHDNDKQREVREQLASSTKLTTKAETEKWHDTHYGKVELDFFAGTISDMKLSRDKLKPQVEAFKSFDYDTATGWIQGQLRAFTQKHSWTHYLDFVDDVKQKKADKAVFDQYVVAGAPFPVNLPAKVSAPIEQAIKAGRPADWSAARALIMKMINGKFFEDLKKEVLPPLAKEFQRLQTEIPRKEADFKKVGGS